MMNLKHVYLNGTSMPVCGIHATRGKTCTEVLYKDLCELCLMWQARECKRLVRKYKGDK